MLIGTTRSRTTTLRTVQGTIGTRRAATTSAAAARPGRQPRALDDAERREEDEGDADHAGTRAGSARSARRGSPGSEPGAAGRSCSPAQRKASTAAGRVKIAGGSLKRAPVEWMKGG